MDVSEFTESHPAALVTDGECVSERLALTTDTDGPCTATQDSGDWFTEFKEEVSEQIKQEPDDVCFIFTIIKYVY